MKLIPLLSVPLSLFAADNFATELAQPSSEKPTASGQLEGGSITIQRAGAQPPTTGPAGNFTGEVRIDRLFGAAAPARGLGARVTFEAGARTAWHTHPLGQTLIVTSGQGWVQCAGEPVETIRPGDVVNIPSGVKHWHGATDQSAMSHIAIVERLEGKSTDWMEHVTDEEYRSHSATLPSAIAPQVAPDSESAPETTPAQRLLGDIAPELARLTDEVLFGEVWERPQLSKRDRSLVTVSALIAMNRPEQLRAHLARARENGATEDELVETITHLAFYSGWPNAVTAVGVAREVFKEQ